MIYKRIFFPDPADTKNENLIQIATPFAFNEKIFMWWFVMATLIYAMIKTYLDFLFFASLAVFVLGAYGLWERFEYINRVKINRVEKKFIVSSRNLIKRLFVKPKTYLFTDIIEFKLKESDDARNWHTRYLVYAVLEDSTEIPFLQSYEKETAKQIQTFMDNLL